MNEHAADEAAGPGSHEEVAGFWKGGVWKAENLLMTFCLSLMVLLPIVDMALRSTTIVVRGSSAIQCHLTLFICMIGGAIAAREARLLSLSTVTAFLKARVESHSSLIQRRRCRGIDRRCFSLPA